MPMKLTEEQLQEKIDAAVKQLKDKNAELLGKLAKFKNLDGVDIEKLKADSKKLEELEQKRLEDEGKWQEAYENLKAENQKAVDELTAAKNKLQEDFDKATINNEVTIGLMGLNIISDLSEVAVSTISSMAGIKDGEVMVGDKPLKDYLSEWADSPVGKHFIKSGNSGGGAPGADGAGLKATYETYFKPGTVNQTKQLELKSKSKEVYDLLNKQYNLTPQPTRSQGMV